MDRLRQLQLYVQIVERGSLTAAADRLGTSVPTVVRALAALERRLGTRLIERSTRRHRLTDEGRDYYLRCRQILADVDAADAAVTERLREPRGRLVVGAPIPFGRRYVSPALVEFVQLHTMARVELQLADRVINLLEEGVDLAVRIGHLPDSSLVATSVGHTRVLTCASSEYLERHGTPRRPSDLSRHACLALLGSPWERSWEFRGARGATQVSVKGQFAANQLDCVVDACTHGAGIGRFLEYQVRDAVHAGRLVPILVDHEPEPRPVQVVYPGAAYLSARVRALRDWLIPRLRTALARQGPTRARV